MASGISIMSTPTTSPMIRVCVGMLESLFGDSRKKYKEKDIHTRSSKVMCFNLKQTNDLKVSLYFYLYIILISLISIKNYRMIFLQELFGFNACCLL